METATTIREFRNTLTEALTSELGSGYTIVQQDISKLNHVEQLGISIQRDNAKANISPIVYCEDLFRNFQDGKPMGEIVEAVIEIFRNNDIADTFDSSSILEWSDSLKDRIRCKLISTADNTDLLSKVPSVPFCNLSLIFSVQLREMIGSEEGIATANITNEMLEVYNVSTEDLLAAAIKNLETDGTSIRSLTAVMLELMGQELGLDVDELPGLDPDPAMYVLTNSTRIHGAAAIVSEGIRRQIAEKLGDCYILPSSIHELLLVPFTTDASPENLLEMVVSVNETEVAPVDKLCDSVFLFHADTLEVELVANASIE